MNTKTQQLAEEYADIRYDKYDTMATEPNSQASLWIDRKSDYLACAESMLPLLKEARDLMQGISNIKSLSLPEDLPQEKHLGEYETLNTMGSLLESTLSKLNEYLE